MILIADNDGHKLKDDKQLMEAASRLQTAGKEVHIVMPKWIEGKTDMNDVLKQKGTAGIIFTIRYKSCSYHLSLKLH